MTEYQRDLAVTLLVSITDVPRSDIEEYADYELEQWLWELGYEWDESSPVGDWVEVTE